jgi:hypothetical protein
LHFRRPLEPTVLGVDDWSPIFVMTEEGLGAYGDIETLPELVRGYRKCFQTEELLLNVLVVGDDYCVHRPENDADAPSRYPSQFEGVFIDRMPSLRIAYFETTDYAEMQTTLNDYDLIIKCVKATEIEAEEFDSEEAAMLHAAAAAGRTQVIFALDDDAPEYSLDTTDYLLDTGICFIAGVETSDPKTITLKFKKDQAE